MNKYGLSKPFSVIVGSELDGRRTDKAEVVAAALQMLGAEDKRKALMVGDRRHDIIGAHKNGIPDCSATLHWALRGWKAC